MRGMIMDIDHDESIEIITNLSRNCLVDYGSWVRIHSLESCMMPVGGKPSECFRVKVDTMVFGDNISGFYYVYLHNDDGYHLLKEFFISKNRDSSLNNLGI